MIAKDDAIVMQSKFIGKAENILASIKGLLDDIQVNFDSNVEEAILSRAFTTEEMEESDFDSLELLFQHMNNDIGNCIDGAKEALQELLESDEE